MTRTEVFIGLPLSVGLLLVLALIVPALAGNTVTVSGVIEGTSGLHADFSANPLSGKPPLLVKFSDQSTGTITSWAWDFQNDGSIDRRTKNAYHVYPRAGTYTVSLTVSGPDGTDTEVKTGYITVGTVPPGGKPIASFTQDKFMGRSPLMVSFTDRSINNPTEYEWRFGDGSSSTEQSPVHTYTRGGFYSVVLKVSNVYGSDTARGMVVVLGNPWSGRWR